MSQNNFYFTDRFAIHATYNGRRESKAKAYAKFAHRRQERHQGKSLLATELQLLHGEMQYQKAANAALKVIQDFESKKSARRLAASRSQFLAFAEQQCIPLQSQAEKNLDKTWASARGRSTFEVENNGTKLVLASCAL